MPETIRLISHSTQRKGIPTLVQVCREVRNEAHKMREEFKELQKIVIEFMDANKRDRAGLPKEVVEEILRQVTIDGVVPVTRDSITEIVSNIFNEENGKLQQILTVQEQLRDKINDIIVDSTVEPSSSSATPVILATFDGEYTGEYHKWPGIDYNYHKVYVGFVWPSDCAFTMWELWWRGDRHKRVCPYRHIDPTHDLTRRICQSKRTKTLKVVNRLVSIAIEEQFITRKRDITYSNSSAVFDLSYPLLIKQLYSHEVIMRSSETNICTLANRLYKVQVN